MIITILNTWNATVTQHYAHAINALAVQYVKRNVGVNLVMQWSWITRVEMDKKVIQSLLRTIENRTKVLNQKIQHGSPNITYDNDEYIDLMELSQINIPKISKFKNVIIILICFTTLSMKHECFVSFFL